MRDGNRIEADDDLLVPAALVTQTDIQLIQIVFGDLRRFLNPDHCDAVNGF